jgi:hypothetical protein
MSQDNLYIDEIHANWAGDYKGLELRHGYIQWLFPIHEEGVNYQAQVCFFESSECIHFTQRTDHRCKFMACAHATTTP